MNGNNSEKEKDSSPQLAGFAPASRGRTMKSSSVSGGGAQSSSSSTAAAAAALPSAASASSDGNTNTINIDTANRITKTKTAASTNKQPAASTKKRSKSSSSNKVIAAAGGSGGIDSSNNNNNNETEATTIQPIDPSTMNSTSFQPMSLSQIQLRIKSLLDTLPSVLPEVPPDYINPDDHNNSSSSLSSPNNPNNTHLYYPPIQSFASTLQTTIEQLNLLLSLVSSATYQWGVDRSGASQQNLSVMNSELQQCQEVISSVVSGRLSNVLCPAVDVLVGRVEIVRGYCEGVEENNTIGSGGGSKNKKRKLLDGTTDVSTAAEADSNTERLLDTKTATTSTTNEQRINHYTRPLVDPSYVHLCHQIVARNGELLRYTLATCIHTAQRVIGDYLKAMKKDVGHEVGKGGYY